MADRDEIDYNNLESYEYFSHDFEGEGIKYFKQKTRINPMDSLDYPRGIFSKTVLETIEVTKEEFDNNIPS